MRRHVALVALLGLLMIAPASASAAVATGSTGSTETIYRCDPSYDNYTGCAMIRNDVQTWTAPGRLEKRYPLVFAAFQNVQAYWKAQRQIPSGGTGDAIVGGFAIADGAMIYSYRPANLPQNHQAMIGFRLSSGIWPERCIEMSFLDCTMGPQLESGRDSKHLFTVTSRPLEVSVINALPQAIKRVDGPYWSNTLDIPDADNAGRIEPTKTGTAGGLRSVVRTSAYAAVYKFVRSPDDQRYNGSTIAISIRVAADGTRSGACTPIFPPSGTRFQCSVSFSGNGKGVLTATIRVQPA